MHHGLTIANHGAFADPIWLRDIAVAAEEAGWDGVFVWDHIGRTGQPPATDPWLSLAAIAVATQRVRIGTMVTPLPRRRPWKVAREVTTLDHLSGGRVTLGVGLGVHAVEFDDLGEETDLRTRAAMLEESLLLLRAFWTGEPVDFDGEHYTVDGVEQTPTPVQAQVPIWVGGVWPNQKPMLRATRFQGAFPVMRDGMDAAGYAELAAFLDEHRPGWRDDGFDVVNEGVSEPAEDRSSYADAGLTWWLEQMRPEVRNRDQALARVQAGPA